MFFKTLSAELDYLYSLKNISEDFRAELLIKMLTRRGLIDG